jgi:hypothetical protein
MCGGAATARGSAWAWGFPWTFTERRFGAIDDGSVVARSGVQVPHRSERLSPRCRQIGTPPEAFGTAAILSGYRGTFPVPMGPSGIRALDPEQSWAPGACCDAASPALVQCLSGLDPYRIASHARFLGSKKDWPVPMSNSQLCQAQRSSSPTLPHETESARQGEGQFRDEGHQQQCNDDGGEERQQRLHQLVHRQPAYCHTHEQT